MLIPPTGHLCAACDATALFSALVCHECCEGVDTDGRHTLVSYCSTMCRNIHQTDHQVECGKRNTRKDIYRAGDLLQSTFYLSRDRNYDIKVKQVEKKDGVLFYQNAGWPEGNGVFQTSPYKLVADENVAHAMMSHLQCNAVLAIQYELSKKILQSMRKTLITEATLTSIAGAAKYVEEAVFDVDLKIFKVKLVYPDGRQIYEPGSTQQVPCVEAHDGEAYIFDPTGAQYGQYKSVLPLQAAISLYTDKVNVV